MARVESPMSNGDNVVRDILVVGGGTAGWLAASHLAKALHCASTDAVSVTLVESPNIPTIGVGEGTVPTMRRSLKDLGISETDFVRQCDATFKQGIRFVDWMEPTGDRGQHYYHHVFDYPDLSRGDLTPYWLLGEAGNRSYVDAVSVQGTVCDRGLGPKLMAHAEYAGAVNYAYHLDAAKFAELLTRHSTERLGVKHLLAEVQHVELDSAGNIDAVVTDRHGPMKADLFVDCSGFRSLLLGEALGVPFLDRRDILFVDTALAAQVPYASADAPIPSTTIATALDSGWIWDIGLQSRRGTGYVYSQAYCDDEQAERTFRDYLRSSIGGAADELEMRRIPMQVGYRETVWSRNCVAIGLSQGFVEPLEATGLLVFDATARMLASMLPSNTGEFTRVARRFNERVTYAWERVIDFIKLHYCVSDRTDSDFWHDNRCEASIPDALAERLALWRSQPPNDYDFLHRQEVFNLDNYLYVLYGMDYPTDLESIRNRYPAASDARDQFDRIAEQASQAVNGLLPHRDLIERIQRHGLQAV